MEASRTRTLEDLGIAAMRRGSYDEAEALGLRPHLLSLAQRRRSAPSLAFEKALGSMPWSSIREEGTCPVSAEQCPFVLGLSGEDAELVLDACVQVTEAWKTRERRLFLFCDVIVVAKLKSSTSYRLKHRVRLEDLWLYGFEDEPEEEEGGGGEIDLKTSLVLAWPLGFCLVSFCSPEVKERWLDTLYRKTKAAQQRTGSTPPSVLMKVLSGSITVKTLSGGGMEPSIEFTLDGNAKIPALPRQCVTEERVAQSIENAVNSKWNVLRKWRKSHSPHTSLSSCADTDSQLFGQPLSKICPVDGTLPKPIKEILVLLRKKGPSTEGVFRKTGNSKNLKVIREQLSSGTDVDMDALPVVLLVGLLKSFLKELPGSLLVSDLYETWMEALETKDVHQLKRVVEKLPGPNTLLLRNILCVLHHIIESQDTNKMDTKNLAVCIAPTLLQKDSEVLDVHTVEKVTELTEFLIEHCCAIFGEDILSLLGVPDEDNLDTVSSQQHDSAYDSTDPDAEGDSMGSTQGEAEEEGEKGGSFPSLLSVPAHLPGTFHTNKHFSRRQSEPIIFNSAEKLSLIGQARSHDDFSGEGRDFEEQSLKKQISDDSFLLSGRRGAGNRPTVTLSLPKLGDPSCLSSCSLDSAASNASEGSVFTSSPLGSPSCLRRAQSTRHAPLSVRSRAEPPVAGTAEAVKRCAQSMRVVRTKSLGAANPLRGSKKCDVQKDKSFPCGTLQEDFQSEAAAPAWPLRQRRPLSAVDVFKQVDCWQPSRPPSYEQALQNAAQPAPPHYGSMTVSAATATLSRKSRPASMNANFQYPCTVGQYKDCLPLATDIGNVISGQQHSVQFRQRTMSESRPKAHHENVSRRCSQSVFEEYSYAKESYV
ncbi:T cell activation RhoGTPase activating protein b [Esox lucius]|uniref:T cell activation RhoGTPase activating protein b n=1 Tax=Esox lucius TaxID=8010 RepID=A0A3P9A1L0_ESOLU|nr:T cell activation RhoGTPase activating protein b [Esox lucius]